MTLFEIKEKIQTLTDGINADREFITTKAADPACDLKDIEEKEAHLTSLQKRLDLLKAEHDRMEDAQRTQLAVKAGGGGGITEKHALVKAKADYYRAVAAGDGAAIAKTYSGLGAIPANSADQGNGNKLLPTTVSNELILDAVDDNSLRGVELTSQYRGFEEPRLSFTVEDSDLDDVVDFGTANEIALAGDTVVYGRFKTKVKATISDTVLHGTDVDLVSSVEEALRGALATKEKIRAFATSADSDHAHMSFYQTNITSVYGDDLVDAIMKAWAALPEIFAANACVVMKKTDYVAHIHKMANGNATLWGKKPEDVIGIPVVFNDRAAIPVIGDFRYARQNYDPDATLDSDKDVNTGKYVFVLTAWGDHQIRLKNAFRLAVIRTQVIGATIAGETATPVSGEAITCAPVYNTASAPASGTTYKWQYLNGTTWTDDTSRTGRATATITTVATTDNGVSLRCVVTHTDANGTSTYTSAPITLGNA